MITLSHLTMRLAGGGHHITILDDLTLEIPDKQRVAIVGPSGSGKSTLLGLIAGLDRPTSGSITLNGVEISTMRESALARYRRDHIGYIFQSFHLIPTLTALENVLVPLELAGMRTAQDRATELLRAVGLEERLHHYPVQLSGGEQQRVAVARAFACHPPILLADRADRTAPVAALELPLHFVRCQTKGCGRNANPKRRSGAPAQHCAGRPRRGRKDDTRGAAPVPDRRHLAPGTR